MLIEFRIGNFRSFAEPQTFSLVASSDARHPDNCIPFGRLQLLKSAVLYGANASGKSNLINAIRFMRRFILLSATRMNVGDEIRVFPFQLSPKSLSQASFFEASFVAGNVRYQYGFTVTSKRVQDEWLIAFPKGRAQRLLERRFDIKTEQTAWSFRGELHNEGKLLKERTRDNGLALSRGAELNIGPLTTILLWFREKTAALDLSNSQELELHTDQTAWRLEHDPVFRERVVRLIRHADLGICELEMSPTTNAFGPRSAADEDNPELPMILFGRPTSLFQAYENPGRRIQSIHESQSGVRVPFNFLEAESKGTQRFFALAGLWLDALDRGALLVIDELDCSLHPTLMRKLVELFQTRDANPSGAQLVFSTHDSTLMDLELFRRDQIWIVEKGRDGASHLSSLYDYEEKPRNNEALQRRYLAGHYGGVPVLGPTFEDLELK
jgi:AAA15 family ATPase/GTPase